MDIPGILYGFQKRTLKIHEENRTKTSPLKVLTLSLLKFIGEINSLLHVFTVTSNSLQDMLHMVSSGCQEIAGHIPSH
jgi:hypothetical protein